MDKLRGQDSIEEERFEFEEEAKLPQNFKQKKKTTITLDYDEISDLIEACGTHRKEVGKGCPWPIDFSGERSAMTKLRKKLVAAKVRARNPYR